MENHVFDLLLGILMAFFAYIGFTSFIDASTLLDSITGVIGIIFSGSFGVMLSSRFVNVNKVLEDTEKAIAHKSSK